MTKPKAYLTALFLMCYFLLVGQNMMWHKVENMDSNRGGVAQRLIAQKSQTYHLDFRAFRQMLLNLKNVGRDTLSISFPMPDGSFISFVLRETPVFEKESNDRYADFDSYTGQSLSIHSVTLKLSMSPYGIHAMVLQPDGSAVYLDPYFDSDNEYYILYRKQDMDSTTEALHCKMNLGDHEIGVNEDRTIEDRINDGTSSRFNQECIKRVYRLALACTGEYGKFHGGTKDRVLAAYNMTMTRVNGIYERDLAISFLMVSDTDKLIYLDSNSDPYSGNNNDAIISQNQSNTDKLIGFSRYDIGHVFTTVNSGLARLRSLCTSSKAMGVSGRTNPIGDPFDIDYVCHELGHQLGANHTQNNDCNRTAAAAVEPGSGSTIMGYAGICTPNIQNNSDSYFHSVSLGQIQDYISMRSMVTCGNRTILDKIAPTISVDKASHTIPISTSFVLEARAMNNTGNNMTFSWEQTDNEISVMPPRPTNTGGPAFRSLPPSASPARYFPDLLRRHIQWEVLPSVSRTMNFTCTARDNDPSGGCTDFVEVEVKVSNQAGPFVVIAPNATTVVWPVGSPQIVSWDAAKTNLAPINCNTVHIYLSTDGGVSYPILLAKDVPNTGQFIVTTPFIPTVTAKIMVKASDNIFFDVSKANFSIVSTFSTTVNPLTFEVCAKDTLITFVNLQKLTNSTIPVTLSVDNLPLGIVAWFNVNPITTFPQKVTMFLSGFNQLSQGNYSFNLIATSGLEKTFTKLDVFKESSLPITTSLIKPLDGMGEVDAKSVKFLWNRVSGASKYQLEWSTSPAFKDNVLTQLTTDTLYEIKLDEAKIYFWRVKAVSPCTIHPFSVTQSFRTKVAPKGAINLIFNEWLLADRGGSKAISNAALFTTGSRPDLILYTILSNTKSGQLTLKQKALNVGDTFTQENINSGDLIYHHANGNDNSDFFTFNVLDDKSRWLPSAQFNIRIKDIALGAILNREKILLCAGDQNAIVAVNAYGGQPPYKYSLDGQTFADSGRFLNLGAGIYQVFVKDARGNIVQSNEVMITQQMPISSLVVTEKYDILVYASGGVGDFTYILDDSISTIIPKFESAANGLHRVIVLDENGCNVQREVNQNVQSLTMSIKLIKKIICPDDNAEVSIKVLGGFPPYLFSSDGFWYQSDSILLLNSGRHIIYIKDSGNKIIKSDEINFDGPPDFDIDIKQKRFQVTAKATGGTGSLLYSINGVDFSTKDTFDVTDNGLYRVYVKDSLGCVVSKWVIVNVLKDVEKNIKNCSCFQKADGSIKLTAQNGTEPFLYSLNGAPFTNVNQWLNLKAGSYKYHIRDEYGDTITGEVIIQQPDSLSAEVIISESGLSIIAKGGTVPYQFSLDSGFVYLDINVFDDLPNGLYKILVKDKNGCTTGTQALISHSDDLDGGKSVHIFPNPFNQDIYIRTDQIKDGKIDIQLFTTDGRKLSNPVFSFMENDLIKVDVSDMPAGLYIIQISSTLGTIHRIVMKNN